MRYGRQAHSNRALYRPNQARPGAFVIRLKYGPASAQQLIGTKLVSFGQHRTESGDIRHVGSLAAYWPPGADAIEEWATSGGTVTFDVNLRPIVLRHQPDARRRLERLVRYADVVKASDEDVRLTYPEADPEAVARAWVSEGRARLAVVTLGARGVMAVARGGPSRRLSRAPALARTRHGAPTSRGFTPVTSGRFRRWATTYPTAASNCHLPR